jgi:hypothetical protein
MPSTNEFLCPYCAAANLLEIDLSGESRQEFVTDCETCCRPIKVRLQFRGHELVLLETEPENI